MAIPGGWSFTIVVGDYFASASSADPTPVFRRRQHTRNFPIRRHLLGKDVETAAVPVNVRDAARDMVQICRETVAGLAR
jgi:hypothetical protein